jgi:hypothetical protein
MHHIRPAAVSELSTLKKTGCAKTLLQLFWVQRDCKTLT